MAVVLGLAPTVAQGSGLEPKGGSANQDILYYYWSERDRDASGWQLVTPLTVTGSFDAFDVGVLDLSLRAVYIESENRTAGASGAYRGWADTTLGGVFTLKSWGDVQPFLVADLNLPTGGETLRGSELNAIMDPDLVWQIRFGEGFNTSFGAGVTFPLAENLTATAAAGHNTRRAFVPNGDNGNSYNPGNQVTAVMTLQYLDEELLFSVSANYIGESTAKLNAISYFDPGDVFELTADFSYALDEKNALNGAFGASASEKNSYFNALAGSPEEEAANSNGRVYFGRLALRRDFGGLQGEINGKLLIRAENDYDAQSDFFLPSRTKWDFGLRAEGKLWELVDWGAGVNYGQMDQDETPYLGDRTFDLWTGSLSGSVKF